MKPRDPRMIVAAVICCCFLLAAVVVAVSGGGSGSETTGTQTSTQTTTAPVATGTEEEPVTTVPTDPVETTPTPPTTTTTGEQTTARPPRQSVDRPDVKILPVKPNLSTVNWPDKKRVAEVALKAGNLIATIDGRHLAKARRGLRPLAAPNVVRHIAEIWSTDPLPASAPAVKGRVSAMSLHNDPQTGARYVTLTYYRIARGSRTDGVMILEFAPARAIITAYRPV